MICFLRIFWKLLIVCRILYVFYPFSTLLIDANSENGGSSDDPDEELSQKIIENLFYPQQWPKHHNFGSLVFQSIFTSLPFILLRIFAHLGSSTISLSSIFVTQKLPATLLSLSLDFNLLRIARKWHLKPNLALFLLESSYLTWSYFSRPCGPLFQTVIFCWLCAEVVLSINYSPNPACANHDHDRIPLTKSAQKIGAILILGMWHRVSFLVLAIVPTVHYLFVGATNSPEYTTFMAISCFKVLHFSFGASCAAIMLSFFESVLTRNIDLRELLSPRVNRVNFLSAVFRNLTFSPKLAVVSLLRSPKILDKPLQPLHWHVFINIPLAFGILGLLCLFCVVQCCISLLKNEITKVNPKYWFFISSFLVPLFLFSLYPLKYVGDVIPLIVPVLFIGVIRVSFLGTKCRHRFLILWMLLNAMTCGFFGFTFHGGNMKLVELLTKEMASHSHTDSISISFFGTLPPAKILLLASTKRSWKSVQIKILNRSEELASLGGPDSNATEKYLVTTWKMTSQSSRIQKLKLKFVSKFPWHVTQSSGLNFIRTKTKNLWRKTRMNSMQKTNSYTKECDNSKRNNSWVKEFGNMFQLWVYKLL